MVDVPVTIWRVGRRTQDLSQPSAWRATGIQDQGDRGAFLSEIEKYVADEYSTSQAWEGRDKASVFTNEEQPEGKLPSVLEVICSETAHAAVTVVIEHAYFDLDFRSEYALSITRKFRFDPPLQDRLHFFSAPISSADFRRALRNGRSRKLADSYLGYVILRRSKDAVVGRSLIMPPRSPLELLETKPLLRRVRTLVEESVTLLGIPLVARGVPFMQQDGSILRCAHVTSWMAHYASVLTGVVPRVTTAELHLASLDVTRRIQRQYPSPGLTVDQLLGALWRCALPPDVFPLENLCTESRDLDWHDRPLKARSKLFWRRENLTSTVARYLNSGLPVLIAKGEHVVAICGYARADDESKYKNKLPDDPSRVTSFVVQDDTVGPYQFLPVDRCTRKVGPYDMVVVPVPQGLSLSGEDAERWGVRYIKEQLKSALLNDKIKAFPNSAEALRELKRRLDGNALAVRTYAQDSSSFKRSFFARCPDPRPRYLLALARLPKYVWVVEIVDRARRRDPKRLPPVLGEAVIDATASAVADAETLFVHLPGFVSVKDRPSGGTDWDLPCGSRFYDSGRWAQDPMRGLNAEDVTRNSKSAGIP